MRPSIIAHDVHNRFVARRKRSPALRGMGREVAAGEAAFLVGSSGSGKATPLSVLGYILDDEPTASLDVENGQAILRLLSGFVRDGRISLVVVTHDVRIFSLAGRILRPEDGRLARADAPAGAGATADPSGPRARRKERVS